MFTQQLWTIKQILFYRELSLLPGVVLSWFYPAFVQDYTIIEDGPSSE